MEFNKKLGDLFRLSIRLLPFGQTGFSLLEAEAARQQGKGFFCSVEHEVAACLKMLSRPPSLCIDVGGNIGDYTAEILHRSPRCRCIIFEPSSSNIDFLHNRFANKHNVVVVDSALSSEAGQAILYANADGSTLASLSKRDLAHSGIDMNITESIQTMRFEDFYTRKLNGQIIDLVKIDIEGHELLCLEGFGMALNRVKVIQFEFGACNIDSRTYFKDFWNFLSARSFLLYRITPHGVKRLKRYYEQEESFLHANLLGVNASLL
jgi:FkbM family methyltransferase